MLEKITNIFSEEEIILAMLSSGNEEKVRKLVADEELIKKYIVLILEKDIAFDEICDIAKNTTSPQLLDIIAKAFIQVDGDTYLLDIVLDNPYCSGETIVYAEENFGLYWTNRVLFFREDIPENGYSKEKLWKIAMADHNGACTAGIIEFHNCDEKLFYKIFENCRCNGEYYSNICGFALKKNYTLREDILEECLDNFMGAWSEYIDNLVMYCNASYLERVMAKIEEVAFEDVRIEAREVYQKRKEK